MQRHADTPFTLRTLRDKVMKTRSSVAARRLLGDLLRFGYATEYPERLHSGGRPAAQYMVAGAAKLASALLPGSTTVGR